MKTLLVGVDWGREHVQFVVEEEGVEGILWKERSPATPKAISGVLRHIRELAGQNQVTLVRVAIEQKASRLVEALLDEGFEVWFVRPQQVDLLRELLFSSKAKDDLRDARAMVSLLRSMRSALTRIEPLEPARAELRGLTRARRTLVQDRTALLNQLQGTLHDCFPEFLQVVKPDVQWFTSLWRLVRTPAGARSTTVEQIRQILKRARVRKITAEEVHARLAEAVDYRGQGDWTLVVELEIDRLELVQKQIKRLDAAIAAKLDVINAAERAWRGESSVTNAEIIDSLPGVGAVQTAVMMAEQLPELVEAEVARMVTGVAPVLQTTGQRQTRGKGTIAMRRACNPHLRDALHLMVECGLQRDAWVCGQYAELRARGQTHGRACRQLGDRMLKRLRAMLRNRTLWESPPTQKASAT